jgi:hypothetical protein
LWKLAVPAHEILLLDERRRQGGRNFGIIRRLGLTLGPQGVGFPFRLRAGGIALAFRGCRDDRGARLDAAEESRPPQ